MAKIALATQIPKAVKAELDAMSERRGVTISHFVTEAIREKLDAMREDEALLAMALERLAEPGERSEKDYRRVLRGLR